ncbi:MAG: MogA/MoaB family molybdenum cofactor biosynthesis protein [Lachnospiraceae bacterium]|nr:MogA/MoaB family molybdenum cofactor biosynthesis protein [Lachnospiraceae bacterium]
MGFTAAVITVSDRGYNGQREDTSGPAVRKTVTEYGYEVLYETIVPDEAEAIRSALLLCADTQGIDLILTTGGTGFSPRDITPEVTKEVIEREAPGIPEQMRAKSMQITQRACLSRSVAGIRGESLIVNLPGSPKAAVENLSAVIEPLRHGLEMLQGGSADCADS